jgi:hypothetical protein
VEEVPFDDYLVEPLAWLRGASGRRAVGELEDVDGLLLNLELGLLTPLVRTGSAFSASAYGNRLRF